MAKVYLICGKLCSGKTTYAGTLCRRYNAVLLSVDEIMLLFGPYMGDRHEEYSRRVQRYLFQKSAEILESGSSVVLDWGFWTRQTRAEAKAFYRERGIPCELHYLRTEDTVWRERIRKRNADVLAGKEEAYYVDENLLAKFEAGFEAPDETETDVLV